MTTILRLYYLSILRIDPKTYATSVIKRYGVKGFEFISFVTVCAVFSLIISGVFVESLETSNTTGTNFLTFGLISIAAPLLSHLLLLSPTRNSVGHLRDFLKLIRLSAANRRTKIVRYVVLSCFSCNIFFPLFQVLFAAILLHFYEIPRGVLPYIYLIPVLSYAIAVNLLIVFSLINNLPKIKAIFLICLVALLLLFWTSESLVAITIPTFAMIQVGLLFFVTALVLITLNREI